MLAFGFALCDARRLHRDVKPGGITTDLVHKLPVEFEVLPRTKTIPLLPMYLVEVLAPGVNDLIRALHETFVIYHLRRFRVTTSSEARRAGPDPWPRHQVLFHCAVICIVL